jgi:type I restriction enzyme S subunit
MITDMPVPLPDPAEQKTIADCLSSLDTCIAGQARRLDLLCGHKQGLLQQLFPSPEVE